VYENKCEVLHDFLPVCHSKYSTIMFRFLVVTVLYLEKEVRSVKLGVYQCNFVIFDHVTFIQFKI